MSDSETTPATPAVPADAPADKTYTLRCHCSANVIEFGPVVDLYTSESLQCNCSICSDRGAIAAYIPKDKIRVKKGGPGAEGDMTQYRFHNKIINWSFCRHCGSTLAGIPVDEKMEEWGVWAVNLRCVEGVDLEKLKIKKHEGKDA